jgi:3-oxoacyl-[acyl-carrier protein] reductase
MRSPRLARVVAETARARSTTEAAIVDEVVSDVPLGRLAEPDDIARLAAALVSDVTSHVAGTALNVDGGRTRASP